MTTARIQVAIERNGGLPRDHIVNTWHFGDVEDINARAEALAGKLATFYNSFDQLMPDELVTGVAYVKVYDLADAEPRVPVYDDTFALVTTSMTPLPAEVAVCLSMRADYVSGQPNARRRGRVYLGPWGTSAIGSVGGADVHPNGSLFTAINASFDDLVADPVLPGDGKLSIFSPTTALTSTIAAATFPVTSAYIDDRFDTQRRRGAAPTGRNNLTVP